MLTFEICLHSAHRPRLQRLRAREAPNATALPDPPVGLSARPPTLPWDGSYPTKPNYLHPKPSAFSRESPAACSHAPAAARATSPPTARQGWQHQWDTVARYRTAGRTKGGPATVAHAASWLWQQPNKKKKISKPSRKQGLRKVLKNSNI